MRVLVSMTGYGESRGQTAAFSFRFELRSVNNRHFKLTLRAPEPYSLLESEFEKIVRRFVRRGTVLVQLRVDRHTRSEDFRIDRVALQSYCQQVFDAWSSLDVPNQIDASAILPGILTLPGVSIAADMDVDSETEWPILESSMVDGLAKLQAMRVEEGARMERQLTEWRQEISTHLDAVRRRQPAVVLAFRDRLRDRVSALLADVGAPLSDNDLIREVTVYADRSDISEEIVRLDSHLQQFAAILSSDDEGQGRKLEFVTQEMGREVNTMGSKAGDMEISRRVVEMKSVMEKIREMLQNVE